MRIRTFNEEDIPAVVALFMRVYPDNGWSTQAACEAYFRAIFFQNPWRDLGLHSLVAEEDGRAAGFYGVIPRPMLFRGRTIRVAVGCCVMVDPDRRNSFIALELAKSQLSGPQDLTLADGATLQSQTMWGRLGGRVPFGYNLQWTRPLRPMSYLLARLGGRTATRRALTLVARPVLALVDTVVARSDRDRVLDGADELIEEPLAPAAMLADLSQYARGKALQPVYDAGSLAWLFEQVVARKGLGKFRAARVLGRAKRPIGSYIYYVTTTGASEVLQLVALDGTYDEVLRRLLADAWRHGAIAVRGRLDPAWAPALSSRHSWLRWEAPATLVHSRYSEITDAIEHGDAFLTRLEGEWWTRFVSA